MSGVNLLFTHDTKAALGSAAALVNTRGTDGAAADGEDRLSTLADLDAFVAEEGWTGSRTHDEAELEAVRELRPRLAQLWELDEPGTADLVNELLVEAGAVPQLVDHDGWGWHLHATPPEAPLATRMAVEAAMAVVDVVRLGELDRLRTCEAQGCEDVLVDLSRNRSKRFCSTACGNRMAAAAYRERQSR